MTIASKHDLVKRMAGHIGLGAVFGYTVLHPASVVIHDISGQNIVSYTASIVSAFYWGHVQMAIYFTILGAALGLLIGLNTHRKAVLHEKTKLLSITDELTGLYNRRYMLQSITGEVQRAERYGTDLSLIMVDIDHFKQFNDLYGHPAGDRLLKQFSARLKSTARKTDIVARHGGEEFLVLMPNTDIAMAVHLAERIRKDIEACPFELRETRPEGKVTVSIGCAHFDRTRRSDAQDMIRAADDCLYRAKNSGRNQICSQAAFSRRPHPKGKLENKCVDCL